jgi:hypothetical protein
MCNASTPASTATLRDNGSNSIQTAVNILLVDDDVWFRPLVRAFLTRSRYRLMEAADVFLEPTICCQVKKVPEKR